MLYFANVYFGTSIGGLMDPQFMDKPWTLAKLSSVLAHLWIPVIVIGLSGTAGMIRRLRANLLDELQKQYVTTARAKGVPPFRALMKYPLRMALNPFISDIGSLLPHVISGAAVVFRRAQPAHHRADAARGAAQPGHVTSPARSSCSSPSSPSSASSSPISPLRCSDPRIRLAGGVTR